MGTEMKRMELKAKTMQNCLEIDAHTIRLF